MAKKRSESSRQDKPVAKKETVILDSEIDFSDIPESSDEELRRAKRVGRPKLPYSKQLIAIRIDPILLKEIRKIAKKKGKPYQTLIHEILEKTIKKVA